MRKPIPWSFKIRLADWPAYYLHNPPEWPFRLVGKLPPRVRWWIASQIDWIPFVCWASIAGIAIDGELLGSPLSIRCLDSGAPCWCGKYQTEKKWRAAMAGVPGDPMDNVTFTFKEAEDV